MMEMTYHLNLHVIMAGFFNLLNAMKEKWLVTGGAGFIGGNFVLHQILKNNREIINLDKLSYAGNLDTLEQIAENPNHHFVQGDIVDSELVKNLLTKHQPDVIVHFAAESHVDRSIEGPQVFIETNVMGTFNMLQQALKYYQTLTPAKKERFRFLHVSTDEVYGSLGEFGVPLAGLSAGWLIPSTQPIGS